MIATTDVRALEAKHIAPIYRRTAVVFERGQGARLFDAEGRAYLDLVSGIGVASLGHAHPKLARALALQAETLLHTSNVYYHPLQGELAARLAALSGLDRAFFCNSGTEAVEACLKFARRFWHTKGDLARTGIVALERSFHGRTFGSLSATWDEHYRAPFGPLVPGIAFISPADPAALAGAVTDRTAAVIVEPIQGEGGVRPLTPAFARALADVCAKTGALLIADEVQSGLGRTGRPFYSHALGLQPDLISIGKALGAGVPVGAALMSDRVASALAFGDHGSTYGGNLLACRAALVFLEELTEGGVMAHVAEEGAYLESKLRALAARRAAVREVRGVGFIQALQLDRDAAPVVEAALARGLLVNRTAESVVRLLPPLTITRAELEEGLDLLDASLAEATA
jgi:predicted acetylornithine/succinylornithine family transaminase